MDKESDTIHVRIENEDTLRSDLEYLAKKTGFNLEELKKERYLAELLAKQDETNKKREKKERARVVREQKLDELFLKEYGKRFFISLNGTRLKRVTAFDDFKCPICGEPLQSFRGWAHQLAERPKMFIAATTNPLNALGTIPCILTTVECKNRHNVELLIQQLY